MANGHGGRRPGAGKKKGTVHESTRIAKEAIELVFDELGGVASMARWARENESDFYRLIFPKLLPVQLNHGDNEGGKIAVGIATFAADNPSE